MPSCIKSSSAIVLTVVRFTVPELDHNTTIYNDKSALRVHMADNNPNNEELFLRNITLAAFNRCIMNFPIHIQLLMGIIIE